MLSVVLTTNLGESFRQQFDREPRHPCERHRCCKYEGDTSSARIGDTECNKRWCGDATERRIPGLWPSPEVGEQPCENNARRHERGKCHEECHAVQDRVPTQGLRQPRWRSGWEAHGWIGRKQSSREGARPKDPNEVDPTFPHGRDAASSIRRLQTER